MSHRRQLLAEAGALSAAGAPHIPLAVLTAEAVDAARFVQHFWEPVVDTRIGQIARPGLSFAGPKLHNTISSEILTLARLVDDAQRDYALAARPRTESPMPRAGFVLKELRVVLEWHFDDGVTNEGDARLDLIESLHGNVQSEDTMAAALEAYASLARTVRQELAQELHFDVSLVDEAPELARQLRERSAPHSDQPKLGILLDRRNRLAALLQQRLKLVRAAARFVFRDHPAIVRQVTSAYQRRTRRRSRRTPKSSGR